MKKLLFLLISLVLISLIIFLIVNIQREKAFYLDDEYYGDSSLIEIDSEGLKALEKDKKSFVVFVYQPLCLSSYDLNDYVNSFLETNKMSFYKILFSKMDNTKIANYVKFCPSLVIYQEGQVVAYLDADSNKDTIYYESLEGLTKWLTSYILLAK